LNVVLRDSSLLFFTVSFWISSRTHTSDKHSGCPKTPVITPEIVDKIHGIILTDHRIKVREIEETEIEEASLTNK